MASTRIPVHLDNLGRRWGWFLSLGMLLILLGIIVPVFTPAATLACVLILGWLMFFSRIVEDVHAFHSCGWGGVLLHVVGAALGILVGLRQADPSPSLGMALSGQLRPRRGTL